MSIALYVLPIERNGPWRGPKYMTWGHDPDPTDQVGETSWAMVNYGEYDQGVVAVEAPATVHSTLAGKVDVRAIPTNLANTVGAQNRDTVRAWLEGLALPGQWVQNGTTWSEVVRTVCGFMLFAQRFDGIRQQANPGAPALGSQLQGNLSVQWQAIPQATQDAVMQTGQSFGYDMTFITPTMVVRQVLKTLADLWGSTPIVFGLEQFNGGAPFTV